MYSCCLCKKKALPDNGSFFRIPRDERRKKNWVEICRMEFTKHAVICEDHFLSTDIIKGAKRDTLMPSAVPFVLRLLEDPIAIPVNHAEVLTTNFNNFPQDILDTTMKEPIAVPENPMNFTYGRAQKGPTILECKMPKKNAASSTNITECEMPKENPVSNTVILESQMPRESEKYKAMIKKLKAENESLQAENKHLKRKLDETRAVITFIRSIFTEGQIKKIMNPGQIQWKRSDISNAIRLHAYGPKAYNYLYKKGFPLPHTTVLEHWCRKINISMGFLTSSLRFVKHCTELTSEDKLCVLALGEMKVVETNENDSKAEKTVKYAQVVTARGLWKSWKRPVFFDFNIQMKTDILYSIIEKLNFQGFPVVAMVCDMGPANRQLWKDLEVTTERPWFPNPVNPKEKVFTFIDAPHLLEVIRYHYLDTGFLCNNKLLTSRPVADLMKNASNKSIRAKLTDEHLSVKAVGGQKLAAQLFSKTTADAIRNCDYTAIRLNKPLETADLIQLFNDWFDVLNSTISTFSSPGKEPFGIALADQQRTLRRMNTLMSSPIIPNKTSLEYFQEAVIITNTALEMMYDYVNHKFKMSYILTNRLNQDVLKHLFGTIRSKGASGDFPTTYEFRYRLRKYILAQNIDHLHGIANVESDRTDWLSATVDTLAISKYLGKLKVDDEFDALHGIVAERDPEVLDELDTANFDDVDILEEGDLVEYISAYTPSKKI